MLTPSASSGRRRLTGSGARDARGWSVWAGLLAVSFKICLTLVRACAGVFRDFQHQEPVHDGGRQPSTENEARYRMLFNSILLITGYAEIAVLNRDDIASPEWK